MNGSDGTGANAGRLNPPGIGFGSPGFPRASAAVTSTADMRTPKPATTIARRPNRPHAEWSRGARRRGS
jgi:hypothetical protein